MRLDLEPAKLGDVEQSSACAFEIDALYQSRRSPDQDGSGLERTAR
jgi:hypothetical protein